MDPEVQEAPPVSAVPDQPKVDVDTLFDKVGRYFQAQPATRSLDYWLRYEDLGLTDPETAYLATVSRNGTIDELRRDRARRRRFQSLDELIEANRLAEEEGRAPEFIEPVSPGDEPEAASERTVFQARFRQALLELPIEMVVIAYALPLFEGNVSALARALGQPQRRTARQVVRIQKHFAAKGLSL